MTGSEWLWLYIMALCIQIQDNRDFRFWLREKIFEVNPGGGELIKLKKGFNVPEGVDFDQGAALRLKLNRGMMDRCCRLVFLVLTLGRKTKHLSRNYRE